MSELIMTKGLPASGKSTWAVRWVNDKPGTRVRVNKDLLREMLHGGEWSKTREKQIIVARNTLVDGFLSADISVVVDDTNLAPFHETNLREIAKKHSASFSVNNDFLSVSVEECIKRDLNRSNSVGEAVIRKMFKQYLAPAPAAGPEVIEGAQYVWLVDIDGTLAHMNGRKPFEWSRVGEDLPDPVVVKLVNDIRIAGDTIVFMSGRDSVCRNETAAWLKTHVGSWAEFAHLFMRTAGDNRKDTIVKRELYENYIAGKVNVRAVIDDRDSVVAMWRNDLGLKVLQAQPGDF